MLIAHGIDLVEVDRITRLRERHGERFLRRVFTQAELDLALGTKRQDEHLAGRFAVKEALLKALGTGLRGGIHWTDIGADRGPMGEPRVILRGEAQRQSDRIGVSGWSVSITHAGGLAAASVVGLRSTPGRIDSDHYTP
ncbi:MAG: holo-ACP synthase [Planctomycetota bacterium]